ncbi:hypothetical protein ACOSP7_006338 [Xanthoceras sorbifolium]
MTGQQLQVLKALDVAKTQWYHFTAILITGMRFFTDAYDLSCIPLITKLVARIYYHKEGSYTLGYLPNNVAAAVIGVAFCGTIAGRLFFGWLGDKMGRKRAYGMTLMLVVVCSITSGLSFRKYPKAVMSTVCFFHFYLGFGIEGDYSLSTIIMFEHAKKKTRGAFIAAISAIQGFGILAGGMVAIIASAAFNAKFSGPIYAIDRIQSTAIDRIRSTLPEADYLWRIIVMFGAIPPALTYYRRTKLLETAHYTVLVAKNAPQAASNMEKVLQVDLEVEQVEQITQEDFGLFSSQFRHRHGRHLLGTASTWFLLDIAFYTQNLFQEDIFSAIEVYRNAKAQILIALYSTVPGYWFRVALIDKIDKVGWFAIQLMGFFFMTVFMFALAILYHYWTILGNQIGFVVMYSLTFFFANFSPNATTFVVSAEIFPARLRSTCHGISTAAGKVRAMVGAFGFSAAMHAIGLRKVVIVLGVVNFLGIMFTFLVPES